MKGMAADMFTAPLHQLSSSQRQRTLGIDRRRYHICAAPTCAGVLRLRLSSRTKRNTAGSDVGQCSGRLRSSRAQCSHDVPGQLGGRKIVHDFLRFAPPAWACGFTASPDDNIAGNAAAIAEGCRPPPGPTAGRLVSGKYERSEAITMSAASGRKSIGHIPAIVSREGGLRQHPLELCPHPPSMNLLNRFLARRIDPNQFRNRRRRSSERVQTDAAAGFISESTAYPEPDERGRHLPRSLVGDPLCECSAMLNSSTTDAPFWRLRSVARRVEAASELGEWRIKNRVRLRFVRSNPMATATSRCSQLEWVITARSHAPPPARPASTRSAELAPSLRRTLTHRRVRREAADQSKAPPGYRPPMARTTRDRSNQRDCKRRTRRLGGFAECRDRRWRAASRGRTRRA